MSFMRIVGDEVMGALEERLAHHEKCRYAYVRWSVPRSETERYELVERHIRPSIIFEAGGKEITWAQTMTFEESSDSKDGKAHVVYRSTVMVDGVKKNIRAIKTAMEKHLARNAVEAMRKVARYGQEALR